MERPLRPPRPLRPRLYYRTYPNGSLRLISLRHRQWLRSSHRYWSRGSGGFLDIIARRELRAAAGLLSAYCAYHEGWTLDLGAGSGGVWLFSSPPQKLIALDFAPRTASPETYPHRLTADAAILPLKKGSITTILALGLLEYLGNLESALCEWRRVCNPEARLLISNSPPSIPNRVRKWIGFGAVPRSDAEIEDALFRLGWRVIENSRRRAGWQSMLVAEPVAILENTCAA